ncbi:hypothetical protein Tco_1114213 [Tanacetum coccineum]|uniref:DNA-directed RNA polymerase n=1 Tax=Tanacetum coccineum TaxID=301880 RepID=A0ABQ5IVX6_9ASTR
METKEVSERYITPCFVDGFNAYDGEINLEYEKNMISNEFAVKLCLEYELKNGENLKLDGEVEVEEEVATKEFIRSYKAIKQKNDPGVFVLPFCLEAKFDLHALADTRSNIYVMPYRIFEKLGREQFKPVCHKITMLDHSKVEPMGILKDVLCQKFLTHCRAIMNTINGTTSTFDGIVHQKFYVANVRNAYGECDSDDVEEYSLKMDEMGKPFKDQTLLNIYVVMTRWIGLLHSKRILIRLKRFVYGKRR